MRFPLVPLLVAGALGCVARPATVGPPMPTPARSATGATGDTVDLLVASTTDVHGRLRGWEYYSDAPDPLRGLSRAATIVDSLRAAAPGRVVLVDAGDMLEGNPIDYVAARVDTTDPHPVMAAMNAMRYDAAAIGNHEFNYGLPLLHRAAEQATFPLLAANAYTPDGRHAWPVMRMVERDGVRIAIVGATTPGSMVWDRDNLAGRLVLRPIVPSVREGVDSARARGADVVIVVVHTGLDEPSSYDTVANPIGSENVAARIAHEVPGIDLIVYGHSHRQMADTVIGATMLQQPKNWATSVGVAHLTVVRHGDRWRVAAAHGTLVPARGHAESPAVLAATQAVHDATVRYVTAPIGSTPVTWRGDSARVTDTPLTDFILEVERRAAHADLASTAAFSLSAKLDSGAIDIAELSLLYPYDNTLRAVRISGRQLRDYLEYSSRYYRMVTPDGAPVGASSVVDPSVPGYNYDIIAGAEYTLDLTKPVGQRVTRLTVGGRPVAPTDSFTLALNNYRQTGGGGYAMLRGAPVVWDRQLEIRQLLIDEVRRRGTIRPDDYFTRNWALEPAAVIPRAYADMHALPGEGGERVRPAAARRAPALPPGTPRLRIIATNDFHGALEARPDQRGVLRGGAAAMAAAIRQAEAGCPPPSCVSLLVDGGDEFQGTPASNLAYGRPVVELFDLLGTSASALGNHEFDWGRDTLRARMRQARYAVLGANVRRADGGDVQWIRDDTIVERGGRRIGIIGVATVETPNTTKASNVAGLRFVDPAPVVDSLARALRARGASTIVVLAHAGAFCRDAGTTDCAGEIIDLARHLHEPVDAIVSGHTHSLVNTTVDGIPIVQALSSGRAIAWIDLPGAGDTTGARGTVRDVLTDSLAPDAAADSLVRRAVARVAPLVERPVARFVTAMPRVGAQYALGNFIADAQRWAGHGDIAVMNNGGIRADLAAGTATYGSLFEVQPFANTLYRISARGADVRAYLERLVDGGRLNVHVSGVTLAYDPSRPAGARLVSVRLRDGRALSDAGTYTVVMSDFMATGGAGAGLARQAIRVEPLGIVDLDALMDYARSRPQPIRAPAEVRIRVARP